MKEQIITIEIDQEGRITADAQGFSGNSCLRELEKLLEGMTPGQASLERKPEFGNRISIAPTQTIGKKS
ncbi:MAG: DUF2997 domain-containing protein [Desulfuromonadales bacterium]